MRPVLAALLMVGSAQAAEYRAFQGHGGPVKAVAISGDRMLSASFDYAAGLWSMDGPNPPLWLEGHEAAVNCVAFLPGGRAVSGGDDFDLILWELATARPLRRLEGHQGKVIAVAVDPDGARIASAGWDGALRIWNAESGAALAVLTGHRGAVNDALWSADGAILWSAGYDGAVIEWDTRDWTPRRRLAEHGFGVNVLTADQGAGWLAYGALDGGTRVIDLASGAEIANLDAGRRPILALARSADGARLGIGDGEGYIMIVETADWSISRDFHAAGYGPIWALDFTAEGDAVVAAGIANSAHLWPLDAPAEPPLLALQAREFHVDPAVMSNGERQFRRKCAICHTLGADGARRAGPALAGLFGRRAGGLTGYAYSPALTESDLIWDAQSIDALFAEGPEHYIPGSKMPMQVIAAPTDRADLIAFLKAATATGAQE